MITENSTNKKSPLVLFMASFFPNRVYPVKGPFIRNFADVVSREYPLVVLTAEADENQPGFWGIEKTQHAGFAQYTVYYNHKRIKIPVIRSFVNFFSFFRGTLKAYKMVVKEHGQVGIHHLHSSLPMGIVALYLKWIKGKPYVFSEQVTIYIFERFKMVFYSKQSLQIMPCLIKRMGIHVAQNRTNRGLAYLLLRPLSSELYQQYVVQEQMEQVLMLD